jgi:phosphatidate cytidylyltransferase
MKQRVSTALIGLVVLLAAIWFETPWFPALIILMAAGAILGIWEFYQLANRAGGQPLSYFGIVWGVFFIVEAHHFDHPYASYVLPILLASAVVLPLVWMFFRGGSLISWAWTLVGILYIGWLLSFYVRLRELPGQGMEWVLLTFLTTFACDTAAFFVGRAWGRRPLAPSISPKKTWEGAIGGLFGAIVAVFIVNAILSLFDLALPFSYAQALLFGLLIGIFAQLGDLFESAIKRLTRVKDAGSLLPGHGGMLDRIDSIVFNGIIAYYYVLWLIG